MKKTLLFLFAISFSVLAFGQSLSLSYAEGPLNNGSEIHIWMDTSTYAVACHIYITNNSLSNKYVKVRKYEVSIVPGTINYFCWYACLDPGIFVSKDSILYKPGQLGKYDFQGDYEPHGKLGTSTLKYTFFDMYNPNDSASVIVHYHATPLSVQENFLTQVKFSNAYPNPAGSFTSFDFNLPKETITATIVFRDLLGSVVKKQAISNLKGNVKIETSDLKDGIYFYSLIVNDQIYTTKKLIVRK